MDGLVSPELKQQAITGPSSEHLANCISLLGEIAKAQAHVLSDECVLFPADIPRAPCDSSWVAPTVNTRMAEIAAIETAITEQQAELKFFIDTVDYFPDDENSDSVAQLTQHLECTKNAIQQFSLLFDNEFKLWLKQSMPPLSGIGQAAFNVKHLHDSLSKMLGSLHIIRSCYETLCSDKTLQSQLSLRSDILSEQGILALQKQITTLQQSISRREA